ncbi:MAG TPA: DUF2917 domain-containing protein [Anaerolineaceae bacterium]|nr:DUF2917 domain-containing protein [Anaerolineaceae bacterium]
MQSAILTGCGEIAGGLVSYSPEIEIHLGRQDLFKLSGDARGVQILALAGALWVTQQGDAQDFLLRPGERMEITRKGIVLVQGFPAARLRVIPAERGRRA